MKKKKKDWRDLLRAERDRLDELLKDSKSTILEFRDVSEALEADLTDYLPNPNILRKSNALGRPLDCTMAERAARKILNAMWHQDSIILVYDEGIIYRLKEMV